MHSCKKKKSYSVCKQFYTIKNKNLILDVFFELNVAFFYFKNNSLVETNPILKENQFPYVIFSLHRLIEPPLIEEKKCKT